MATETAPTLTRKRTVLEWTGHDQEYEIFGRVPEDGDEPLSWEVHVPKQEWLDMGQPDHLTLAVWPEDRQDLMDSEDFPE